MSNDNSTVIGAVILARHGDRQGFYQDPNTYSASATAITPLGEVRPMILWVHQGRASGGKYPSSGEEARVTQWAGVQAAQ